MSDFNNSAEDFGIPKSRFIEFLEDLRGRLACISDKVNYRDYGLTLADVRKPILCLGKPGIGKTSGVISIINELNQTLPKDKQFGFKKILLGQTVVGTLSGIPVINNTSGEVKREQAPELPTVERDGEYGILFLDEITTADEAQVQPALGLCDDSRNIGEYTLPEHWLVVAAGNGVDCTNFLRMDDMTLSRFSAYDINYDYVNDWRPYAHAHNIDPMIIAYLNFKPSNCVAVESEEQDEAGKMFPCPRTWERLSIELKIRNAMGKPVRANELSHFAGRIIGKRVGREFASFCACKDDITYSPEKIIAGTERNPEVMKDEVFHIILESCIAEMKKIMNETRVGECDFPSSTYQALGNMTSWFLKTEKFKLELVINAICEMTRSLPDFESILVDDAFSNFCPEFDKFINDHSEVILVTDTEALGVR